jgi:hypothetical protein
VKRLLLALVLASLASPAPAQMAPVKAQVYSWNAAHAIDEGGGRAERLIFAGSTLDLDSLDVRAVTMPAGAGPDTSSTHDSTESFFMV